MLVRRLGPAADSDRLLPGGFRRSLTAAVGALPPAGAPANGLPTSRFGNMGRVLTNDGCTQRDERDNSTACGPEPGSGRGASRYGTAPALPAPAAKKGFRPGGTGPAGARRPDGGDLPHVAGPGLRRRGHLPAHLGLPDDPAVHPEGGEAASRSACPALAAPVQAAAAGRRRGAARACCRAPGPSCRRSRWPDMLDQAWASLLYRQNWLLADTAVDYYAQDHSGASPLQHFWSLSIQGQVFILWPLIFAAAALLLRGCSRLARIPDAGTPAELPGAAGGRRSAPSSPCLAGLLGPADRHQPGVHVLRHQGPALGIRPRLAAGPGPALPEAAAGCCAWCWAGPASRRCSAAG